MCIFSIWDTEMLLFFVVLSEVHLKNLVQPVLF